MILPSLGEIRAEQDTVKAEVAAILAAVPDCPAAHAIYGELGNGRDYQPGWRFGSGDGRAVRLYYDGWTLGQPAGDPLPAAEAACLTACAAALARSDTLVVRQVMAPGRAAGPGPAQRPYVQITRKV